MPAWRASQSVPLQNDVPTLLQALNTGQDRAVVGEEIVDVVQEQIDFSFCSFTPKSTILDGIAAPQPGAAAV